MVLNLKGKQIKVEKGDLLGLRNGQTVVFDTAVETNHRMVFVRPHKNNTQRAASDRDTDPYPIDTDEIKTSSNWYNKLCPFLNASFRRLSDFSISYSYYLQSRK